MEPVFTFGLGSAEEVDLEMIWPDGAREIKTTAVNKTVVLRREDAIMPPPDSSATDNKMFLLLNESAIGFNYRHEAAFPRDRIDTPLMPHTLSNLGPALAKGDINSDNLLDLFVGGGPGQPSAIYLQQSKGTFTKATIDAFEEHRDSEDIDALFFDATGNGYLDLYVVSGAIRTLPTVPFIRIAFTSMTSLATSFSCQMPCPGC
ncbi:MAG: VCBS repeat-containing protein [Balneolaceae bacterium]|nr:VCBS repeat-containing protein [Balneolaceae bacterium]